MRRTEEQWLALIQAQAESGLSAAEFCKQQQISGTYFSTRKHQLRQRESCGAFVPAFRVPVNSVGTNDGLCLRHGSCALQFDKQPSALWLAQLMQALS
jgi:hypothetical protein